MKKSNLNMFGAAFVGLMLTAGCGVARASAGDSIYSTVPVGGPYDTLVENSNTDTFTLTDPYDTIENLGTGTLSITGDITGPESDAGDVDAKLITSSTTYDLIVDGAGPYDDYYGSFGPPIATLAFIDGDGDALSYSTTDLDAMSYSSGVYTYDFSSAGGSYTPPVPETTTVVGFGVMLLASSIIFFSPRKRISSAAL